MAVRLKTKGYHLSNGIVSRNISACGECTTEVQFCSSTPSVQHVFIKKGRNQSSLNVRYMKEKF
jgi:hypothetical protein